MSKATRSPTTKPEAYTAYKNGEMPKEEALSILGDDWEEALQLIRVEDILSEQPEPEVQDDDLLR